MTFPACDAAAPLMLSDADILCTTALLGMRAAQRSGAIGWNRRSQLNYDNSKYIILER